MDDRGIYFAKYYGGEGGGNKMGAGGKKLKLSVWGKKWKRREKREREKEKTGLKKTLNTA